MQAKRVQIIENDHSPEAIAKRLSTGPKHSYLRDWVYGGIDGAVTTFAVVSSVVGAELSARIVLIMGVANLIADGFSMAASNYLGTKTEAEELKHFKRIEHEEIKQMPEGEREEVRQMLAKKGFQGAALNQAVDVITSNRENWVRLMLTEEYGLPTEIRSPKKAAFSTFSAFVVCGLIPLAPFLLRASAPFEAALGFTGVTFFLIGSLKSHWSVAPWWKSGAITLLIGGAASAFAYVAGILLKGLV